MSSRRWTLDSRQQMGVPGFEPGTSALSELRSNQLSYTPFTISEFLRSGCVMSSDRRKVSCIDRMNRSPERNLQSCEDLSGPGIVCFACFDGVVPEKTDNESGFRVRAIVAFLYRMAAIAIYDSGIFAPPASAVTGTRTPSARNAPSARYLDTASTTSTLNGKNECSTGKVIESSAPSR